MINLLPENDKKELKQEYLRRKIIVIGFFVFAVVLIGVILLLPVFWFLDFQEENYGEQLSFSEQRFALSDSGEIISGVKDINSRLLVFEENQKERKGKREISWIIEKLINMKPENIKIEAFVYTKDDNDHGDKKDTIMIRGFSVTRNDLLNFVDDLRSEKEFSDVSLPTSSLLTEGDVDFSIFININESSYEK